MASVTIEVDLPPGVEITGYERHQDGHGFEVRWPLPERCRCQRCGHEDHAHIEFKTRPRPSATSTSGASPASGSTRRPSTAVRGATTASTSSLRSSGRTRLHLPLRAVRAAVADRQHRGGRGPPAGISAETVEHIVEYQLAEDRMIDPKRVITDIGLDELSLKKRHRLYVT